MSLIDINFTNSSF